ncbi:MAG TPA: HAD family phosphatase [Gaiellaceae bacterium]|nr:HAD family phosphatase [Gaiellaceae bacterium]
MIEAVVFDLDGVIVDSEHVWDDVRQELAEERGGTWHDQASRDMMGMSSPEWSRYMHDVIGLSEPPDEINAEVVRRLEALYREEIPLLPGAVEAVQSLAARWPLGLASSSNRELIDLVLETSGLDRYFKATVSSEEVPRGKPAPDVYLEAARRLGADPARCAAVEDSENGIRSAKLAGMRVIAIPNPQYPPADEALELADAVLPSTAALTPEAVEAS